MQLHKLIVNKKIVTVPGQGIIPAAKITPMSVLVVLHKLHLQLTLEVCIEFEGLINDCFLETEN